MGTCGPLLPDGGDLPHLADGSTLPMSRLLDLTYSSDAGQAEAVFQLERITDPEQVVSVNVFGETIPVS